MTSFSIFAASAGIGLLAGASSCALAQAGMLTAALTPRSDTGTGARGSPSARRMALLTLFLAGKLVSHTAVGALLGATGQILRIGPGVRAILLALAAVVMFAAALRLLRIRGLGNAGRPETSPGCPPPSGHRASGLRPDQDRDRNRELTVERRSAGRAALLGAGTVVAPCAVTISVALIAVSTRSAAGGAAAMAGFVVGTYPVFALLGLALTRALGPRGRYPRPVGMVLLVLSAWTLVSALRVAGWWPSWDATESATPPGVVTIDSRGVQQITVHVTDQGYRPAFPVAESGRPTRLIFRGHGAGGCARTLTFGDRGVPITVPPNGRATVELASPRVGRVRFVCTMGMYAGAITFRGPSARR